MWQPVAHGGECQGPTPWTGAQHTYTQTNRDRGMSIMSNYTDKMGDIKDMSAYSLAGDAECATPDSQDSAGALFLSNVRDALLDRLSEDVPAGSTYGFDSTTVDYGHDIADNAVPVYTYTKWLTFTDLAAWQEDVSELSGDEGDMDNLGSIALYLVAERLVCALLDSLREAIAQDDADTEES